MIKKTLTCYLIAAISFLNAQQTKILFIGNSYTFVNNLPQTLHDLALSKGDSILFDMSAVGGYRFLDHLNDTTTLSKINQQPWDYVVLQDQSQWPSFPPAQVATGVYPFAKRLDSLVLINNPCSETVFYMTWGRENGDPDNCGGYPPLCTFDGMNARLRESYLQMAQDNHASTSPVGVAWKKVRDTYPAIQLYQADESHPTVQGTYLAACVFYATLFHRSPVGGSILAGVTTNEALQLQTIAASTVLDSLSNWQQYGDIPNAAFSYTATGNQVQFTNLSTNTSAFQWQFGDNTSSTQMNPLHTYTSSTVHDVTLTAASNCKHFTAADTVISQLVATGIHSSESNDDFSLSPNPASEQLALKNRSNQPGSLQIINMLGEVIFYKEALSGEEKIMLRDWPKGVYYAVFSQKGNSIVKKIIKN